MPCGEHADVILPHGTGALVTATSPSRTHVLTCTPRRVRASFSSSQVVVLCFALFLGSFYPAGLAPNPGGGGGGLASKQLAVKESYAATGTWTPERSRAAPPRPARSFLHISRLSFCACVQTVKSRSLLSTFEDEPLHLLGLGGEYPDRWEDADAAVVMAAWRRSGEQQKSTATEETSQAETHPPFRSQSNKTSTSTGIHR